MGMLIEGRWEETPVTHGAKGDLPGAFMRRPAAFRRRLTETEASSERRYHLMVSLACPWAHRTLLVRHWKGLEDRVSVSVVDYLMGKDGWVFSTPESETAVSLLREVYLLADPKFTGKVTVPVLWDKQEKTIVNNESRDIITMFDTLFPSDRPSLYPEPLRASIDAMIDANYDTVNNGVYRAGFAGTQAAYETAVTELFARLDALELHLAERRHLVGPSLTLADICLFTTLVRFDAVYVGHFKCNLRRIVDYPHVSAYLRDLYQRPGIAELCDFTHIKGHYYRSHEGINPTRIVPLGPISDLERPHDRARLP